MTTKRHPNQRFDHQIRPRIRLLLRIEHWTRQSEFKSAGASRAPQRQSQAPLDHVPLSGVT